MRNVLIGCGLILSVFVGMIVFNVFMFGSRIHRTVNALEKVQSSYAKMADAIKKQNEKYPFTPPADGIVTPGQFAKWLEIRRTNIPMAEKLKSIHSSGGETKNAYKLMEDVMSAQMQATDRIIAALEQHQISSNEYQWISMNIMAVLDSGDGRANPRLKPVIVDAEKRGSGLISPYGPSAPHLTSAQIARMLPMVEANCDAVSATLAVFTVDANLMGLEFMDEETSDTAYEDDL